MIKRCSGDMILRLREGWGNEGGDKEEGSSEEAGLLIGGCTTWELCDTLFSSKSQCVFMTKDALAQTRTLLLIAKHRCFCRRAGFTKSYELGPPRL